jgi:hypothetical protein
MEERALPSGERGPVEALGVILVSEIEKAGLSEYGLVGVDYHLA